MLFTVYARGVTAQGQCVHCIYFHIDLSPKPENNIFAFILWKLDQILYKASRPAPLYQWIMTL